MIYITGDTHGAHDIGKLFSNRLSSLTKNDYVIICGDCGVLCSPEDKEAMLNLYSYLPFTVLFADGNHENFDMLESFPEEVWHGGKVHRLTDSVLHLMRGQVFDLEGDKFFVFGGALSFDKRRRKEGESWWPQEMPTKSEYDEAKKNLASVSNKVDYIISHDCPESLLSEIAKYSNKLQHEGIVVSDSNSYLNEFSKIIDFKHWYFAHYHCDITLGKYDCLFNRLVDVKNPDKANPPITQGKQQSETKADEYCPNCHHHCHKDNLRCNRGRKHFGQESMGNREATPHDRLLSEIINLKRKYEKSTRKNQALNCFSNSERNILIELLRKIEKAL